MVPPSLVPLLLLLLAAPVLALPAPVPCSGTCEVPGSGLTGFFPPVAVIASGSEVEWSGTDIAGHINYEGLTNFDAEASCFLAQFSGSITDRVRFTIEGAALVAEEDGVAKACASAIALPGGAQLLTYQCVVHPLTMKAGLLVLP